MKSNPYIPPSEVLEAISSMTTIRPYISDLQPRYTHIITSLGSDDDFQLVDASESDFIEDVFTIRVNLSFWKYYRNILHVEVRKFGAKVGEYYCHPTNLIHLMTIRPWSKLFNCKIISYDTFQVEAKRIKKETDLVVHYGDYIVEAMSNHVPYALTYDRTQRKIYFTEPHISYNIGTYKFNVGPSAKFFDKDDDPGHAIIKTYQMFRFIEDLKFSRHTFKHLHA